MCSKLIKEFFVGGKMVETKLAEARGCMSYLCHQIGSQGTQRGQHILCLDPEKDDRPRWPPWRTQLHWGSL